MSQLIIVSAQINLLVGDIDGNANRIIETATQAHHQYQADLVIFPELALTSYPPEDLLFRADFLNDSELALAKICEQTAHLKTALIVGHPHANDKMIFNMASVIHQGSIIASYAKQELPNYTVFDEKRYFTFGASPCVFTLNNIPLGLLICEDGWFPGPTKQAVDSGAKILISINASPFDRNQARARETMLAQRAHEVHVPIIYVNLVGGQDELVFDGGSMVINEGGQRCQQAPYFEEALMPTTVTLDDNNHVTVSIESLPPRLTEEENIYKTLVLGVHDYIKKNHFPGAIIGLSGGIDSALMLAIAVDAIGANHVTGVLMPSRYTRQMSIDDAILQANLLGVRYHTIPIEPIFQSFLDSLASTFAGQPKDTTEENLQARIRGSLLMALSNKFGHIVLSTGNKSEMAVGYATLYGDMAGGFAALKDIPKTMVYRLAHYRNTLGKAIPPRIIEREPSAELSFNQFDQDTLPPYSILDQILYHYVELDQSPEVISATGIDRDIVYRVISMVKRNEYKRRQAPIGIRTTQKAFGKDRRYPITSGYRSKL